MSFVCSNVGRRREFDETQQYCRSVRSEESSNGHLVTMMRCLLIFLRIRLAQGVLKIYQFHEYVFFFSLVYIYIYIDEMTTVVLLQRKTHSRFVSFVFVHCFFLSSMLVWWWIFLARFANLSLVVRCWRRMTSFWRPTRSSPPKKWAPTELISVESIFACTT